MARLPISAQRAPCELQIAIFWTWLFWAKAGVAWITGFKPILDAKVYENAFEKIDSAIFLRKNSQ